MNRFARHKLALIAVAIVAVLAAHDFAVPVHDAFGARAALYGIERYQAHVSPHLHGVIECRFTPTCSHYGHGAIAKYGLLKGGAKTAWRIARCGPWTKLGTVEYP